MVTVGKLLKKARLAKAMTIDGLEEETKIKKEFLLAIEAQKWERLPEYPVLQGFVKNIAAAVNIDRDKAVALLRRDYPPKKLPINPKPDVEKEIKIGPRVLFGMAIAGFAIVILIYLGIQYKHFVSPPALNVTSPTENEEVSGELSVTGKTDSGSTVRVNGQPAVVDDDGNFATKIVLDKNVHQIEVKAVSRSGKETTISRTIVYKP